MPLEEPVIRMVLLMVLSPPLSPRGSPLLMRRTTAAMRNSTIGRSISTGSATKEKLLRIGLDQISVCGLSGVTLGQLASASGLSKSGLFAHFRSKEQLQVDLLNALEEAAG